MGKHKGRKRHLLTLLRLLWLWLRLIENGEQEHEQEVPLALN